METPVYAYTVVDSHSLLELSQIVNGNIADGWQPVGCAQSGIDESMSIDAYGERTSERYNSYFQTMVKYSKPNTGEY